MDWLGKALLTALSVVLVLVLARRGGRRAAGIVAALPTVTAPALAWMAHDRGDAFATQAATAGVAACAMLAAFAVVHARVARHRGVAVTLACGLAAAALLAEPVALASGTLAGASAFALAACLVALRCLPTPLLPPARPVRTSILGTALVAAGLGALTVALAPLLGSVLSGLLASLPLISGVVAATEQASTGPVAAADFLRGYVAGLPARASFCATFSLLGVPLGWFAASVAAGLSATCVALLMHRLRARTAVPSRSFPSRAPDYSAQRR